MEKNSVTCLAEYGVWQAYVHLGINEAKGYDDWVIEEFGTWREAYEFAMCGPTGMGIVV